MVSRILTVIGILILWIPGASGNDLTSSSQILPMTATPESSEHTDSDFLAAKVQICSRFKEQEVCNTYPDVSSEIFRGTVRDWGYFFNRCDQFDAINNLTDASLIIGTLIAMPHLGFYKTFAAEIGIGFMGAAPYPEDVNKTALRQAAKMVYFMLKNQNKVMSFDSKYLVALQSILSVCSISFQSDHVARKAGECLSRCHSDIKSLQRENRVIGPIQVIQDASTLRQEINAYIDDDQSAP